jgi:hypothetical protein
VKHAGPQALSDLEPVLRALREHGTLTERTAGSFYMKSKAFLHFHEDAAGLFADVKADLLTFRRHRVSTRSEQKALLALVSRCLIQVSLRKIMPSGSAPERRRTGKLPALSAKRRGARGGC